MHASGADSGSEDGVSARRIPGGSNNALYQVQAGRARYACKLCVIDERRRAAQEYGALRRLYAAGLDIAPQPLYLDTSGTLLPLPLVVYRWLPGQPLTPPLTAEQLAAFLGTFQRAHALRPGDQEPYLADSWFHWFDFERYLAEMDDFLKTFGPWLAASPPDGQSLQRRLARLVEHCARVVGASGVNPGRERVALGLCRVDANLANTVWGADGRLRWVDWEYCGWGDPALDLVGPRWHAALEGLSAEQQRWLRDNYCRPGDDPAFDARVVVWDHIISSRWAFLVLRHLWSQYNGPDRVRLSQTPADPAQVRARLTRFIGRAERLAIQKPG